MGIKSRRSEKTAPRISRGAVKKRRLIFSASGPAAERARPAQQRGAVENKLGQAGAAAETDVTLRQPVGIALAGVLTAGEQLMPGDGQHLADILDQGNVRVAEASFP